MFEWNWKGIVLLLEIGICGYNGEFCFFLEIYVVKIFKFFFEILVNLENYS